MPTWGGLLSDDAIWKIIAFIKNSDKLPAPVDAQWRAMADAATPHP
jgi:hypothetical protein